MNHSQYLGLAGGHARRGLPAGVSRSGLPAGASLVELTIVLALATATAAMSAPVFASTIDAGRVRQAAQYLAAQCRSARMEAIARSTTSALVFDQAAGRWRIRRCIDGNGNGVRRADIGSGRDTCAASLALSDLFSGVTIATDASLPDPDGGPGSADAVRFGASDIASFTAAGTATAGTLYLRSAGGAQFAVRVSGVTGRTRILRFDDVQRTWTEV